MSEYGFCLMNDNQNCNMGFVRWMIIKIVAKTDISFSMQGIMQGPLSKSDCSSSY